MFVSTQPDPTNTKDYSFKPVTQTTNVKPSMKQYVQTNSKNIGHDVSLDIKVETGCQIYIKRVDSHAIGRYLTISAQITLTEVEFGFVMISTVCGGDSHFKQIYNKSKKQAINSSFTQITLTIEMMQN